jgi:hypothetical protein
VRCVFLWYVTTSRIMCGVVVAGEVVGASCYTTNGLHDGFPWPVRPTPRFCVLTICVDEGFEYDALSGNGIPGSYTVTSNEVETFPVD